MLDGRIKTIKNRRCLRTCREWVEQYVAAKTVKPPAPEVVELALVKGRQYVYVKLRKGGMGYECLRSPA